VHCALMHPTSPHGSLDGEGDCNRLYSRPDRSLTCVHCNSRDSCQHTRSARCYTAWHHQAGRPVAQADRRLVAVAVGARLLSNGLAQHLHHALEGKPLGDVVAAPAEVVPSSSSDSASAGSTLRKACAPCM
jgi:hypothetical protein